MKKALITGVTGQDGSYLAELLLEKGYEVYGLVRRSSAFNTERIDHLISDTHLEGERAKDARFFRIFGDLTDASSLARVMRQIEPDEIYNLGAQSHVRVSFDTPGYTCSVDALGCLNVLETIRETELETRFYQASSSEMFGQAREVPQSEETPFNPQSPYACAKVFSYWITKNYRHSYNMFACNGILFNHESPRRGKTFVTRKITRGLARITLGLDKILYLGNLEAKRDWGYAKDYVEGMWLMLQQDEPDDYVLATGEVHSVRYFVERCCLLLNMDLTWKGKGADEIGIDANTGRVIIRIDPYFYRPSEVDMLVGNYAKAKKQLAWEPKVRFDELVKLMLDSDLENEARGELIGDGSEG
ncbi:MAG: GDP-mannose 4,6-dehydratase [Dehalococcoidales bacterium]|nr:GDP-mannose 4,6-dehydratase [Dehalococcoidales bacterium]